MPTEEFPHDFGAISQNGLASFSIQKDLFDKGARFPHGVRILSAVVHNDGEYAIKEQSTGKRVPSKIARRIYFPGGAQFIHIAAPDGAINSGELIADITVGWGDVDSDEEDDA